MSLPPGWIATTVVAIMIQMVAPLALGVVAWWRLGVSWRYFAYGALIFFVFQMVTRVPAVQVAQVLLADTLRASPVLTWVWIAVLSFTAGLFEEIGRWVGYRWLFRPEERTWRPAIMYGLGHGGLESMLLIAGLSAISLIGLLSLSSDHLAQLPPEQREAVQAQLDALASQPAWLPLLGAWERLSAIALHVGLSVTVLQVFRRGSASWLGLAILAHTLANFIAIGLLTVLGPGNPSTAIVVELVITLMAGLAIWVTWRLRDEEAPSPRADGSY